MDAGARWVGDLEFPPLGVLFDGLIPDLLGALGIAKNRFGELGGLLLTAPNLIAGEFLHTPRMGQKLAAVETEHSRLGLSRRTITAGDFFARCGATTGVAYWQARSALGAGEGLATGVYGTGISRNSTVKGP